MTIKLEDIRTLEDLGRIWGVSCVLPPAEDNIRHIQAGPPALKEAVTYFAIAADHFEKARVVECFMEAAGCYINLSFNATYEMFEALATSQK